MSKSNIEIEDFIKKSMVEIEAGLGTKYAIEGPVNFELSLGVVNSTEGKFNLQVLGLGTNRKDDVIQTVTFSIRSKEDPEFKMNNVVMSKLSKFIDQPTEKILQDLSKLSTINPKNNSIQSQDKKLIHHSENQTY